MQAPHKPLTARPAGVANRAFHRLLDVAPRVDGRDVLNSGTVGGSGGARVAAELLVAVRMMQAEAITAGGRVDHDRLRRSEAYLAYRGCTRRLVGFHPGALTTVEERLAFWINLYNA